MTASGAGCAAPAKVNEIAIRQFQAFHLNPQLGRRTHERRENGLEMRIAQQGVQRNIPHRNSLRLRLADFAEGHGHKILTAKVIKFDRRSCAPQTCSWRFTGNPQAPRR
jgi:hypothetical protein